MNGTATHQWTIRRKLSKLRRRQIVQKLFYPPPHLEVSKDIATKRGEALSGWQIYRRANFHAEISVSEHITYIQRITADDIYDKTHASVAFVVFVVQ